jgi:hypothetical protein
VTVARPALIIYSFAPKEVPNYPDECAEAHDYIRALWRGCDALGISQPLPGLNVPTAFPNKIDAGDPLFRIVAAKVNLDRRAKKEDYQAFVFEYQDVVGFLATLETNSQSESISGWKALLDDWIAAVGGGNVPGALMEETYLFTVLHESSNFSSESWLSDEHFTKTVIPNLAAQITAAMPANDGGSWRAMSPYVTDDGYCIWGGDRINDRRTVALVASQEKKDDLFGWTAWAGSQALAPFARYLMHAAKLRFAHHVFQREIPRLHGESRQLDIALNNLVSVYKSWQEKDLWNPHELTRANNAVAAGQTNNFELLYGISRLKELSLTAQIAARNMRQLVPAPYTGIRAGNRNLFQQDRARGSWLREQIDMDLGYLRALRQRVSEGHQIATLLLQRQSENTSRRLKNLVLLQGTVFGSLTVGLLMIPAFEVHPIKEHPVFIWAVLLLLMAIVLALPVLFERWHEEYTWVDRCVGGLLGASVFFFGAALWEFLAEDHWVSATEVSNSKFVVFILVAVLVGFLLGYIGVGLLERFKSSRFDEPGVIT